MEIEDFHYSQYAAEAANMRDMTIDSFFGGFMVVCGFDKLTLLDFPRRVACIIFTGGCNFRCPYCHNGELVVNPRDFMMDVEEIYSYLRKRRGLLDGVVVTGGEPLIHGDICELLSTIREMGYAIKLDTNGTFPDKLQEIIDAGLVDYIAMDIKGAFFTYSVPSGCNEGKINDTETTDIADSKYIQAIKRSIDIVMSSGLEYEFRTTVVKGIHQVQDFHEIGEAIQGAKLFYIQNYKETEGVLQNQANFNSEKVYDLGAFTEEELKSMAEIMKAYVESVDIR